MEKEKRVTRNTKGITLIALVITIILLLILAGVVINLMIRRKWNTKTSGTIK